MMEQFVSRDFCLKCRGCCRFKEPDSAWSPSLLEEERKLIPAFAVSCDKKIRLVPSAEGASAFSCPFLNTADNKCGIYDNRPFECRLYPFLINKKEGRVFLAMDRNCPFIKEKLESQDLKEYSENLAELLNSPRYKKCLSNNPHIIQPYPEAVNLVEIKLC